MTRDLTIANKQAVLFYVDAGTDKQLLEQDVIRPLLGVAELRKPYPDAIADAVDFCENVQTVPFEEAAQIIAEGDVALFIEESSDAIVFSMRKFEKRGVVEPPTSSVLKGPREGFIEEIKTNVQMVRRRLKTPHFVVKNIKIGRYSTTSVSLLFVKGIAAPEIVEEVERRLLAIDIDGVPDTSYLVSFISSNKMSLFGQAGSTEKPDVVAAKLLEGRVAIVVDGSPVVVTVPFMLLEDMQDSYDYYSNDWRGTMVRFLRLLGAVLTVLLPGAYVALQTYHFHLLPLKFLVTLMSATTGIPFPPAIEMLFVLILFEILNQASIRMPRFMGISLSIVGAIVLGDTAVKAGLISSPTVLVTALSAIGIFCIPDQVGTMSILRIAFLCVSAVLGLLGMIIMAFGLIAYLVSIDNFGTPYLAPYAPRINPDLKDGILKASAADMRKRPYSIRTSNHTRMQKADIKSEE